MEITDVLYIRMLPFCPVDDRIADSLGLETTSCLWNCGLLIEGKNDDHYSKKIAPYFHDLFILEEKVFSEKYLHLGMRFKGKYFILIKMSSDIIINFRISRIGISINIL